MEFELLPAQKEFMIIPDDGSKRDIALYQGGFGSGKTFCGSLIGICLCMKYPGVRVPLTNLSCSSKPKIRVIAAPKIATVTLGIFSIAIKIYAIDKINAEIIIACECINPVINSIKPP